ncbi:MAG: phage portal protein, partial [Candidatus Peribacteraceae bacterium]|nr:phage portal protein [Candidatus Peribacteraceae bacterium]
MRKIKVEENFIDKAIHYIDPVRGEKRLRARAHTASAQSHFKGASRNRKETKGWKTKQGDADQKINDELGNLRERSLSLFANSPLATGAINTNSTSVVGSGLILRPAIDRQVLNLSDAKAEALEDTIRSNFNAWAEDSKHFDLAGTHNFYESTELADRNAMLVGDTFINMPYRKRQGSKFGLKVQLIDGCRVSNKDNKIDTLGLSAGVEKDGDGMPIAYHILNMHPSRWDGKVKR